MFSSSSHKSFLEPALDYHTTIKSQPDLNQNTTTFLFSVPSNSLIIGNYLGRLRFPQKREEEDDHTEWPAKLVREEALVCARSTNSPESG